MFDTIIFRGDGGADIGLGHLGRLLALALAARARGWRVRFILNDDATARAFIASRGFDDLAAAPADRDAEIAFLIKEAEKAPLVTDVRGRPPAFYRRLREAGIFACALDDMGDPIAAPLVVNGDAAADYADYKEVWPPQRFLLGTRYIPLPPGYEAPPPAAGDPHRNRLLITFGGADADDFSGRALAMLEAAAALPPLEIDLALGPAYARGDAIGKQAAASRHRVIIHAPARDMLPLYDRARVALCAGGITQYEILSRGIAAISIPHVERERAECRAFAAAGAVITFENADLEAGGAVADSVARLWNDEGERSRLGARGRAQVDGRGAERILDALVELTAR